MSETNKAHRTMQQGRLTIRDIYDRDIYKIRCVEGEKYIHILGYAYIGDNIEYNSFCGLDFRLSEFIERYKAETEFVNDEECGCKQYFEDFDSEKELEEFLHMGNPSFMLTPLRYGNITMETPCGHYIDL